MSVAPYPEYKDSGVEWIGRVPTHWRVFSLKYLVSMQSGDAITSEQIEEVGEFPVFGGNGLRGYTGAHTHQGYFVLIGRQGALCGNINYARGQFWASEHAVVVSPRFPCAVIWLGELLRCMNLGQYSVSAAQPGLSVEALGNLRIPVPPPEEQSAIAAFLDQETGKIDALVAEQERLIALLKEKRQAVISQAVTKGLNPNAPMKASGIEWLGQVPAHWRVGKAAFYLDVLSGFAFPSEGFSEDEQATRLLRGINVSVGEIRWDDVVYWRRRPDDQLERYLLRQGDLVIGMDRPWIAAGVRVARLGENDTPCLLLQRVARLSVNSKLNDEYLYSLLASDFFIAHFSPDMTGVSVPHISPDQIKGFVIPIPPIAEQHAIISHLKTVVEEIDTLITEATQAITFLRERRAALISAAVTGKIDVRSLTPTKQEAA